MGVVGLLLALACALFSPARADSLPAPEESPLISLKATPVPLSHRDKAVTTVGRLTYLGGLHLSSPDKKFGGISGFVVSPDGEKLLGVSDQGYWFLADLDYDGSRLATVSQAKMTPLTDTEGKYIYGPDRDAEAVTLVDGSGFVVSFEGNHRFWYYQAANQLDFESILQSNAQTLTFAPDLSPVLSVLPDNFGIEALTTLQDGRMLAISESGEDHRARGLTRSWIIGRGEALPLAYKFQDRFRPTDMATLPNGDVLVLERHFSLAKGMASRLRLIKAADIYERAVLKGEVIAEMAFPYNLDNMEALAVRQNDKGETLIYMMSDDNYNPLQRTLLMMFRLED